MRQTDKAVFHLARDFHSPSLAEREKPADWPDDTIYNLFKRGIKKSEIRYLKKGFDDYWLRRLCRLLTRDEQQQLPLYLAASEDTAVDLTSFLQVHRAWLVESYPKNNLPRLEADITSLLLFPRDPCYLEISVANIMEVLECKQDTSLWR